MKLKILIADDHALLRQGMRQLLGDANPEYEFAEADGLDATLDALATGGADLLLIDLGMPGMAGAESLRALREAHPATKVAVLTGSDDRGTILECLGAGVHGYILKSSPVEEIHRAISTILAGGVYVAPSVARLEPASAHPPAGAVVEAHRPVSPSCTRRYRGSPIASSTCCGCSPKAVRRKTSRGRWNLAPAR